MPEKLAKNVLSCLTQQEMAHQRTVQRGILLFIGKVGVKLHNQRMISPASGENDLNMPHKKRTNWNCFTTVLWTAFQEGVMSFWFSGSLFITQAKNATNDIGTGVLKNGCMRCWDVCCRRGGENALIMRFEKCCKMWCLSQLLAL